MPVQDLALHNQSQTAGKLVLLFFSPWNEMQVEEQIAREQQLIARKAVCQGRLEEFVCRR